jgi:gamma-glutamyltranspeptidase / glutathione hydrolase
MRAGVAAGHPATADVGIEILDEGGTAADAAVAMCLASCVAETVMTGLLGGGHAIWWDGSRAGLLDCFVAAPSGRGEMRELPLSFGEDVVPYAVGPASCGVPGVPAGLGALWQVAGRLPWRRLVEPSVRLAKSGTLLTPAHARVLAMLEPAFVTGRGAALYATDGATLAAGATIVQPGMVETMECLAEEGPGSAYRGTLGETLLEVEGVCVTRDDLASYAAAWHDPVTQHWQGVQVLTRGGLSGVPELLSRLPRLGGRSETERTLTLVSVLEEGRALGPETHTTNLVAVDGHGRACVLTTSLGLGSGDWLRGFDLHLNSMLGEHDLVVGELSPGDRMESMMAPTLAFDDEGLALAIGSAGGTRLRTALVSVLAGILDEGLDPDTAVSRPRVHPAGTIHAEPGVDEGALLQLESQGRDVRRWPARHHYFGGVSCVGRGGPAGDPRRDGVGRYLA